MALLSLMKDLTVRLMRSRAASMMSIVDVGSVEEAEAEKQEERN